MCSSSTREAFATQHMMIMLNGNKLHSKIPSSSFIIFHFFPYIAHFPRQNLLLTVGRCVISSGMCCCCHYCIIMWLKNLRWSTKCLYQVLNHYIIFIIIRKWRTEIDLTKFRVLLLLPINGKNEEIFYLLLHVKCDCKYYITLHYNSKRRAMGLIGLIGQGRTTAQFTRVCAHGLIEAVPAPAYEVEATWRVAFLSFRCHYTRRRP